MLENANCSPSIAVKDIEEAKKFYGEVLGLTLLNEDRGNVSFRSGEGKILVYPSEFAGSNKATYAGWVVDDVPAVAEQLKAKGVTLEHYDNLPGVTLEGDVHKAGDMQAIWFTDPSGNILSVTNQMG